MQSILPLPYVAKPGFELMYHDSGKTMHFLFFTIKFFPPTQKIAIPKKVSVS